MASHGPPGFVVAAAREVGIKDAMDRPYREVSYPPEWATMPEVKMWCPQSFPLINGEEWGKQREPSFTASEVTLRRLVSHARRVIVFVGQCTDCHTIYFTLLPDV